MLNASGLSVGYRMTGDGYFPCSVPGHCGTHGAMVQAAAPRSDIFRDVLVAVVASLVTAWVVEKLRGKRKT